jgi:AsmA family protein
MDQRAATPRNLGGGQRRIGRCALAALVLERGEHTTVSCVNVTMEESRYRRRWGLWALTTLGVAVALIVVLLMTILLAQDHLRGPVIRFVATQWERPIRVDGRFEAHLLSLHPRIVTERVTIGNPPWTPPGVTAEIGRLSLTYDLPFFGQSLRLRTLEMEQATLHLTRDQEGRANWQFRAPGTGRGTGPPLIRSVRMPNARVYFNDERRHLNFDGTVSAQDAPGEHAPAPLRIDGAGQLNGHAVNLTLHGDPLATVVPGQPYHFEFAATSSGTRLTGRGSVPRPFDFRWLETTFESAGDDMKDLYFLTGMNLPDTGGYHLSGQFTRQEHHFDFTALDATSGRSDVRGTVLIETRRGAPAHVEADLRSQLLRLSDLGARAAGRAPKPVDGKDLLLPDTPFQLRGARRSDALIHFHAQTLEVGHIPLRSVAAKVKIDEGTMVASPVSGLLMEGKVSGEIKIDVTRDTPSANVDLRVANLKLGKWDNADDSARGNADDSAAPLEGPLQARIALQGRGNSIHELASNANGTVTAVLPNGTVRSSLAELAGLDLRALGLMAAGSKADSDIRCGVASFNVEAGTLTAQRLLVDTTPVLITGEGTVALDSEALNLQFKGRPKHPRLRVKAPLWVRGTLRHPTFSIEAQKSVAQAGGAIALGVLLTPVAAMLAFVDPGLAKDSDCGALLAQAQTGGR